MVTQKICRPSSRIVSHACVCRLVFDCNRPKLQDYSHETEIQTKFVRGRKFEFVRGSPILCSHAFAYKKGPLLTKGATSVTQPSPKRSRINLFYVIGFSFQCKVNPKYLKSSSSVADGVMATKDMLTSAYGDLIHNTLIANLTDPLREIY